MEEDDFGRDQGRPCDGEHGADAGNAAALVTDHRRLGPVQEQLSRRKLARSQLVLHLGHLCILWLLERAKLDEAPEFH